MNPTTVLRIYRAHGVALTQREAQCESDWVTHRFGHLPLTDQAKQVRADAMAEKTERPR